jgi:hypothetical protein
VLSLIFVAQALSLKPAVHSLEFSCVDHVLRHSRRALVGDEVVEAVEVDVVHRADADHTLFEHLSACQRLRVVNDPKFIDFGTAERQAAMGRNPRRIGRMPKSGS